MRIGVDLDDTICRTTEKVQEVMESYAKTNNINLIDLVSNELAKEEFFRKNLAMIYKEVGIKRNVQDVLRRIKNRGNNIFIVTGRKPQFVENVDKITEEWLSNNGIEVDGIFLSAYGESKADICKNQNIDLMIDDDPYNYKMITSNGCACILFDDKENFNLKKDYATSWLEIEDFINKFRK